MAKTEQGKAIARKIKNDISYERTRENMAEFSRAGKAAKLLRNAFRELTIHAADKGTVGRLIKVFTRVVYTDPVSARGERVVSKGDMSHLRDFSFGTNKPLNEALYARYTLTIDRATGQVTIAFPSFVPRVMVAGSIKTTHFRIIAAAATIDFDKSSHEYAQQVSDEIVWSQLATAPLSLVLNLPANSAQPIMVALALDTYQKVNSISYPLRDSGFNTAGIVEVNVP